MKHRVFGFTAITAVFVLLNGVTAASAAPSSSSDVVTVLITGCSSGIGKSTALELSSNPKFKVWATMRHPEVWKEAPRDNLVVSEMDVESDESVSKVVQEMLKQEGKIDIVINNAGIGMIGCLESLAIEDAKKTFDVNVWGTVRVLQHVLPSMRNARKGHIINISSIIGLRGFPGYEYYAGSKFALEGITDSMRYSLSAYNIHVTNVNPGPVKTGFASKIANVHITREFDDPEGFVHAFSNHTVDLMKKRFNGPDAQSSEEVAKVVANVAIIGQQANKLTDVPFTIGTSKKIQTMIEDIRKHPTGWSDLQTDLLKTVPELPPKTLTTTKQEL